MNKKPISRKIRVYVTQKERVLITVPWSDAKQIDVARAHIDHLVYVKNESLPTQKQTKDWLAKIPEKLRKRLIKVGLVIDRSQDEWPKTMCAFMVRYVKSRVDWKKHQNHQQAVNKLFEFFGSVDRLFGEFSVGEAQDFHRWMQWHLNLSPNTAGQHIKRCKQMVKAAMNYGVAESNPFDIKYSLKSDSSKNQQVTQEMYQAVLEACPTQEWRALIAITRIAGARCPSEIVPLCWRDIDWEKKCIRIQSPKTAGSGKTERLVPLFAKLEQELVTLRDECVANDSWGIDQKVFPMVVDESQNLRKGLVKIVEQAGMTPWPKPFMALRRSARNELEDSRMFTDHQLEQWFGHSLKVAQQYYLDINPATIKKAAEFGSEEKCPEKCPSGTFTRMQEFLKKVLKPMNFDKFRETVALLKVEEYTHQV